MPKLTQQSYTPMMTQYLEIKKDYTEYIVFFRLGDFYEMFFTDAIIASKELEIVLTGRDAGQEERVPMCGVPYHAVDVYIERLIAKHFKVAIVEQVEDPKTAKNIVKREVVRIITPGTITEPQALQDKQNNFLVAVVETKQGFILGYADCSTGESGIVHVPNDFELLADEITNLQSKEIVMKPSFPQKKLRPYLEQYPCVYSLQQTTDIPEYYRSLVQEVYDKDALQAFGLLLQYLLKTQRKELMHLQKVVQFDAKNYLRMDHNTIRNLELLQTSRFQTRKGSLFDLLDRNQTAMGSRYLKQSLLRPFIDSKRLEMRYNIIDCFNNQFLVRDEYHETLKRVYDLERIIGRISFGSANPKDLIQLARSLHTFPILKQLLLDLHHPFAKELSDGIVVLEDLAITIDQAIVEDPPLTITEGGIFKSGYHRELDQLRSGNTQNEHWLTELEAQERERTGIKKLRISYNRVHGYYIEVTKGQLDFIKDEFGYERRQTLTGSERFVTPELKAKEALILGNQEEAIQLEYTLFLALRNQVKNYIESLQRTAKVIAESDMICSFAILASEKDYIRPQLTTNKSILIEQGRHPVVEALLEKEAFIKNDLVMQNDTDILLITGPNMAGKSTYMRQLALIAIMAQVGSFVPASRVVIPLFDQIFTRIGASDDLSTGKSTFMIEMLEVQYALKNATERSLILFDEIGRGTATYDGMALAQAIIEYAHHTVKAKILFSTHYHELTFLEDELPGLKNVHVMAKEEHGDIVFLHKVAYGPTDRSYGIHVAKLAGMPKALLKRANAILESLEQNHGYNIIKPQTVDLFNFEEAEETIAETSNYQDIIEQLEALDINDITPLKAMNILADVITAIKQRK